MTLSDIKPRPVPTANSHENLTPVEFMLAAGLTCGVQRRTALVVKKTDLGGVL